MYIIYVEKREYLLLITMKKRDMITTFNEEGKVRLFSFMMCT